MSSKTKIIVLHMKEIIYTGIFAILGIILIIFLILLFVPGDDSNTLLESRKYRQTNNTNKKVHREGSQSHGYAEKSGYRKNGKGLQSKRRRDGYADP